MEIKMKNKMLIVIGGLLAALLVVGVVGATVGYAQSSPTTLFNGRGPGDGGRGGPHLGQVELEAAAKALDMTADELSSALKDGKTLQDVADEAGVAFEDVQAAIQAAHAVEMRDRIQQALKDGKITQANADWLLEGLDKGYIGTPGGFGFGGPRGGHGFGEGAPGQPMQQSNP
jgi:hypothetical protein